MAITVEAVYENGVLKPVKALPLAEHEKVRLVIQPAAEPAEPSAGGATDFVARTYGLLNWTGDSETLRRIAEDDEFGLLERP